jgi:hypothetical protein
MKNKYSAVLWLILGTLLFVGALVILMGAILTVWLPWLFIIIGLALIVIGLVLLCSGGLMFTGLKSAIPTPTKVWLLTWFGSKTDVLIRSWPVLLLEWPSNLKPVSYVEFKLENTDHKFEMQKPIKCKDGYVYGFIDTTMRPDDSTAASLSELDNAGGITGVIKLLDGMFTSNVQAVVTAKKWDVDKVEQGGVEILQALIEHINGLNGKMADNVTFDDIRGFGVKFPKFVPVFKPADKVIDARNELKVEEAQRNSQDYQLQTVNTQIEARFKMYKDKGEPKTLSDCRDQILQENALDKGAYKEVVNKGGVNIVGTTP